MSVRGTRVIRADDPAAACCLMYVCLTVSVCLVQAHAKFIVYAAACQDATVRELITETEQPFLRCAVTC